MSDQPGPRAKQLEAMLDVARSAMAAFDSNGNLIHSNHSERMLFGRNGAHSALGQSIEQYLAHNRWFNMNNEPIELADMPISRAMKGEEIFEERMMVERRPGDMRYILMNARPLVIDGEFSGAAMISLDLTSLRETADTTYTDHLENAVRRSRMIADIVMEINDNTSELDLDRMASFAIERISREFKAESGVLWLLDENERFMPVARHNTMCTTFNPAGYSLDDFKFAHDAMERNQPIVVDQDGLEGPEEVVDCMGPSKSVLVIPLQIRGDRIGIAYICIANTYVLNQSDRLFASVWGRQCAQGIEVARLFDRIEEASERLIEVIDQMPQAILLVDAGSAQVSIANSVAGDLFGREITEGMPVESLHMCDSDGLPLTGSGHPLLRAIRSGEKLTGEMAAIPQPDGTMREVVANHVPFRDARGQIYGGISVLQDRADFASMDRAREEYISVVGHELRNPLTSLRGNLQLLQRRLNKRNATEDTEDDLRRIAIALSEADRIGDLVTRVLDVSRAGLDRLDIQPAPLDAAQLVRSVAEAAQARSPEREVVVSVPDAVAVEWDADRMYQVLGNLTQNADRYASGTPLHITLNQVGQDKLSISVRDHGPGVSPAIRRRLFRQYYRFDDGATDSLDAMVDGSRGLGIGLYISSRLVTQHGGRMRVQDAEGGGAEFIITMPKVATRAAQMTNS